MREDTTYHVPPMEPSRETITVDVVREAPLLSAVAGADVHARTDLFGGRGLAGIRVYLSERGVRFIEHRDGRFLACCPHCDRTAWFRPEESRGSADGELGRWPAECLDALYAAFDAPDPVEVPHA